MNKKDRIFFHLFPEDLGYHSCYCDNCNSILWLPFSFSSASPFSLDEIERKIKCCSAPLWLWTLSRKQYYPKFIGRIFFFEDYKFNTLKQGFMK